jgi:hypothetical protein
MGTGPTRRYRPDLSEHFILVHTGRQWGIKKFNSAKTKAQVTSYSFDDDGDLCISSSRWRDVRTDDPRGPYVSRRDRKKAFIHDFIKPLPNPYA